MLTLAQAQRLVVASQVILDKQTPYDLLECPMWIEFRAALSTLQAYANLHYKYHHKKNGD